PRTPQAAALCHVPLDGGAQEGDAEHQADRHGSDCRRRCSATSGRGTRVTSTDELLDELAVDAAPAGILDEGAKREIRRAVLTAICVPGYQVPFGSREMPVARGWGSGGLQITLAVIGADDVVKVIDQGDDAGVNATNLRRMIAATTGCAESTDTREATVGQTRHPGPEGALRRGAT